MFIKQYLKDGKTFNTINVNAVMDLPDEFTIYG